MGPSTEKTRCGPTSRLFKNNRQRGPVRERQANKSAYAVNEERAGIRVSYTFVIRPHISASHLHDNGLWEYRSGRKSLSTLSRPFMVVSVF